MGIRTKNDICKCRLFFDNIRVVKVANHHTNLRVLRGDKCGLCCTASENSDIEVWILHGQLLDDGSSDIASCSEAVIEISD